MDEQARKIRNLYMKDYMTNYRAEHKEKLNKYQREWRRANREKVKQYDQTYWKTRTDGTEGGE